MSSVFKYSMKHSNNIPKIQHSTTQSTTDLSLLLNSFHNLLATHNITPTLIQPWDVQTRFRSIDPNEYIQSIHENDTLCSLMLYRTYTVQTDEGVLGLLDRYYMDITDTNNSLLTCPEQIDKNSTLTQILSEKQVAYVNHLESFFPKQGYGRKTITHLQKNPTIDTIVLTSTPVSNRGSPTGFYKRLGFKETGYYMDRNPIMVWTDPSKYV